ncbi:MAG: hypothetical protein Q7S21_02185 [archaeon]|nr:hypothetical protein [archaeon]
MSFGQKGQEFSVFKLLISAIIALAILAVLMPIIGSIFLGFGTNPNDEAVTQIKNLYNKPSQHVLTKAVTFTQASGGLNAKSIATGTQLLSQSQLWLGTGDFGEGEFALSASGGIINYTGSGSKSVKLSIMCDAGKDIDTDLTENGLADIKPTSDPPTACDSTSNETCCIILLRSA